MELAQQSSNNTGKAEPQAMLLKVANIGRSARLDAILTACRKDSASVQLYAITDIYNARLTSPQQLFVGKSDDRAFVRQCIEKIHPNLAIIGPEEPLAAGVADMLAEMGIPCVGPTRSLARLETSKSFTRILLSKYKIDGNPQHNVFYNIDGIESYLRSMSDFVIKPDGLTGGKGVKVSGEHLYSINEALSYCNKLFSAGQLAVVIEEKLDGEEFSLQSFFDGMNIVHTIPVQDHKRAWDEDRGPNTGGMGSYSCRDHLLPFLYEDDVQKAQEINRRVGEALLQETGEAYKGILYGGFMVTAAGLRVVEYNARFGDPEVMNVLPIMQTNLLDVCKAIVDGTLHKLTLKFENKATVCKYLVPEGYPDNVTKGAEIDVTPLDHMTAEEPNLRVYYGAVEGDGPIFRLTGSRAIALVGIGDTVSEAESIAERAAASVHGPVYHRKDIGTAELIQTRINHMQRVGRQDGRLHLKRAG